MPTPVLIEKVESRKWSFGHNQSVELVYVLTGVSCDVVASTTFASGAPLTYYGLSRQSIDFEADWVDTLAGDGRWIARVRYARLPPATGDSFHCFDTLGGMQHVTQSILTMGKYPPTAPNHYGAIGVTDDGVEGVDIPKPSYGFSETHYLAGAAVGYAYRGTLARLTSCVNNAYFKGLDAGECLFLGAAGSQRGGDDWEITFHFAGSPNKINFMVGNINVVSKAGWDYMWVRYINAQEGYYLVKKPAAVYIEQVHEVGNFGELGIGI